jgi:glyoxylase-like metal-dependent hydrolase (beta-lactamase superfamily II)
MRAIFPNVFQLKIPLPNNPLKHLNSYLILAENQRILIDTGMDPTKTFDQLHQKLVEVGIHPQELTDIIITHWHIDHVGLVPLLQKISKARLILHTKEVELSKLISKNSEVFWNNMVYFNQINGVPTKMLAWIRTFLGLRNVEVYKKLSEPGLALKGGEEFAIGEYCFQVIWTPGHSPGHICLYEPTWRFLIAGDLLLPTITPVINQWRDEDHPLDNYFNSLEKIEKFDLKAILPAHEDVFTNHSERINQLKEHYKERALEILTKLQTQKLTAYQIASRLHWNIHYSSWEEFPAFQKYLAVGETLAHLKFLENQNKVKRDKQQETIFYHVT